MPFKIVRNDITKMKVDAIVNAANPGLRQGGGVCGAIFAAAGPAKLKDACKKIGGCATGQAVITPGFNLPAKYIIHTAAPIWSAGDEGAKVAGLARCYMSSIRLAHDHGIASLAFPCLGTGNYGWPRGFACAIAIASCEQALETAKRIQRIVFCCFTEADAQIYRDALT